MKKIVHWLGKILMLLSMAFIAQRLWEYHDDVQIICTPKSILQMVMCSVLYAAVVYTCPLLYRYALYITANKKINYPKVAYIYCKSNILKYLPGNFMQYVGRNEITVSEDISQGEAALATLLEILATILSTIIMSVTFSGAYTMEWVSRFASSNRIWVTAVILIICLIMVLLLCKYREKILSPIYKILHKDNIRRFAVITVISAIIMLANSIIYFYVLYTLGIRMEPRYYWTGIGLYSLSFVLGYITPGVPGGIGIRETILVYFFSAFINESEILAGSVIFRIISVIGDLLALMLAITAAKKMVVENEK